VFAAGLKRVFSKPGLLPSVLGWSIFVAGVALLLIYPHLSHHQTERLLLTSAALLLLVWGGSRWMLARRVAWLRAAMQRAGQGEFGVRLQAMGEPAWDAIAEAFNATMAKLEQDRELLVLRESELQQRNAALLSLRVALDSHAIVSVTATNGDIVFVNDKFCRTSGYAAEELLGRNHRLLKSGAHDAEFYRTMWATIVAGQAWHGVIENRRKDGGHYWVQSSILPVLDAHGLPRHYISIRTDISSRERLRQGLEMLASAEQGDALFARLVQGLSIGLDARWTGLSRLCPDGGTLEVVACWDASAPGAPFRYALAGAPCEHAMATDGEFVVGDDVRGQFPQALALATLAVESYRGLAVNDRHGRPIGVLWAMSERTADADAGEAALLAVAAKRAAAELSRLHVETELVESEARFRALVENVAVGIYLCNPQGGIVYANPPAERLYAMTAREAEADAWMRRIHAEDVELVRAGWQALMEGRVESVEAEFRLLHDAQVRHVHGQVHPVRVDGRLMGYVGSVEDVTERRVAALERRRLQSELQQAQKMEALGQLTGGIAHDFNNILASILGYASLAHSRYAGGNAKLAEYLAAVITAGERARDLIAKMLAFSRETPRERGNPIDVAALVREVATLLASVIPSSITIAVDVAVDVPRVQLGATDLHQVLVNLAVNARDAMGESGRLDIAVAGVHCGREVCSTCHELVAGDYVEIVCRDTGAGMDEALLKRVFEPFFTTKEVGKGTGMGLAVVHGIVHRAGGHILVASTPGVGTAFRLLLPPALAQPDDTPSAVQDAAPRRAPARSGRILVVDDEPMLAHYLRELLENHGHEVTLADDGQAALELLRERAQDFDLVITDQTMPRLSGVGLVKALRGIRADLPAVLCTGFSDMVDLRGARALGVRRFLRKPVEAQTMLRVVSELLEAAAASRTPQTATASTGAGDEPAFEPGA